MSKVFVQEANSTSISFSNRQNKAIVLSALGGKPFAFELRVRSFPHPLTNYAASVLAKRQKAGGKHKPCSNKMNLKHLQSSTINTYFNQYKNKR